MALSSARGYSSLDDYVVRHGGPLVFSAGGARRQRMLRMILEEWPPVCPADRVPKVLSQRVNARIKQEYGSVILIILAQMLGSMLIKLVIEWWLSNHEHTAIMEALHAEACRDV